MGLLYRLKQVVLGDSEQTTYDECFACVPGTSHHDPNQSVRILCHKHSQATKTISGDSLPTVYDRINAEMSGEGPLEGAPLQWLFGGISVEGNDGIRLKGWCLHIPAIFLVAEDRFGASSWLEFWVTDLSLDATDFRCPPLDDLALGVRTAPAAAHALPAWAADVAGEAGRNTVERAWMIWEYETLVAERRAATGRSWPIGDEVFDWVHHIGETLTGDTADSFAVAFANALQKRLANLHAADAQPIAT